MLIISDPDVGADIDREIEYQSRRGYRATRIEMSPETHEAMRLRMKAPQGAMLREHSGFPVSVNRRFIGLNSWRIHYTAPSPVTEKVRDRARLVI